MLNMGMVIDVPAHRKLFWLGRVQIHPPPRIIPTTRSLASPHPISTPRMKKAKKVTGAASLVRYSDNRVIFAFFVGFYNMISILIEY